MAGPQEHPKIILFGRRGHMREQHMESGDFVKITTYSLHKTHPFWGNSTKGSIIWRCRWLISTIHEMPFKAVYRFFRRESRYLLTGLLSLCFCGFASNGVIQRERWRVRGRLCTGYVGSIYVESRIRSRAAVPKWQLGACHPT